MAGTSEINIKMHEVAVLELQQKTLNLQQDTFYLQVAVVFLTFLTLFFLIKQLKAAKNATEAQSILDIVDILQDEKTRISRGVVRTKLSNISYAEWTEEDCNHASSVCASYDVVASLLKHGLLENKKVIFENWGPSIIHCYQILMPHIESNRNKNGGSKNYWSNFSWLHVECRRINR